MKHRLEAQFARFNALSVRERVILFLLVIGICIALADVMWLSPAQVTHKQLKQRMDIQSAELQHARDAVKSIPKPGSTTDGAGDESAADQMRVDEVNQAIKELLHDKAEATHLELVLVHLLRRHEGLTLVRTSVVVPQDAVVAKVLPVVGAVVPVSPVGFSRQGFELTVSGPYPELTRYVQTLEKAMPNVRWGVMNLKSAKLPPELTLQLFLIQVPP